MNDLLISYAVIISLSFVIHLLFYYKISSIWKARLLDRDLRIDDLNGYVRKLKSEKHSMESGLKQLRKENETLEAVKRNPTVDCVEMLAQLKQGGTLLRIDVMNPENVFYWSPGDKR